MNLTSNLSQLSDSFINFIRQSCIDCIMIKVLKITLIARVRTCRYRVT